MSEMFGKIRSALRRSMLVADPADVPSPAQPVGDAVATPPADVTPAKASASPPQPAQHDAPALPSVVRSLESKLDAMQSRVERTTHALQVVEDRAASTADLVRKELETMHRHVAQAKALHDELRAASEQVTERQRQLAEQQERFSARLDAMFASQRATEQRAVDAAREASDSHQMVEQAIQSVTQTREEIEARDARRSHEYVGRTAGVLVISFVALTVALATLVLYALGGFGR